MLLLLTYPDTGRVAQDIARELDAARPAPNVSIHPPSLTPPALYSPSQFPSIMRATNLALIRRHNHTHHPDSQSSRHPPQDHDREPRSERLNGSSNAKDQGAPKEDGFAAKDVCEGTAGQRGGKGANLEDGNHCADFGGGGVVEVGFCAGERRQEDGQLCCMAWSKASRAATY